MLPAAARSGLIFQQNATAKAAQHEEAFLVLINDIFHEEAAARIRHVIEVDPTFSLPPPGQVSAFLQY